ncbi:hypothetical protein TNCV_3435101 [Trichonephila clavipes]|nr:hypothetical protein TNCV_3435101 [Trichonephila clavipes]
MVTYTGMGIVGPGPRGCYATEFEYTIYMWQPKPSSLRAQAQLKHELKLELVEEKQKLLDIRAELERRENARGARAGVTF